MTIYDDELIWEAEAPDYDDGDRSRYRLEWCPSDRQYWLIISQNIGKSSGSDSYYPITQSAVLQLGRMIQWHDEDLNRRQEETGV